MSQLATACLLALLLVLTSAFMAAVGMALDEAKRRLLTIIIEKRRK